MPAPTPYTPPQPTVPPNHPSPRISRARHLSDRSRRSFSSNSRHSVSPGRDGDESSENPAARRQIFPSTSSDPICLSPSPVPSYILEEEELTDPEHFIRAFSSTSGSLYKFNQNFFEKLERYLVKVNLEGDTLMPGTSKSTVAVSNVNFAEAALVVQGSTRIYGKKVDLLFDAALSLFRLLSAPFEDIEEEEEEAEGTTTTKTKGGSKRPRLALENRDLAEDILLVDNFKEGNRVIQKKTSQLRFRDLVKNVTVMRPLGSMRFLPPNIPQLVRKTKTLGTSEEESQKLNNRRIPQFGLGLESRGFIEEYRLNEIIRRPDSMLVDHVIPVINESNLSAVVEEISTPINKTSSLPMTHCDSGIDSCPSSVYNPVENIGSQEVDTNIWDGSLVATCGDTDANSLHDDGFASEGPLEGELEESELVESKTRNDESITEAETAMNEYDRCGADSSGFFSEVTPTEDERDPETEPESHAKIVDVSVKDDSSPSTSALMEVEFTPSPRRNKRKSKNFKLPCKLSLLLPEKKRKLTKAVQGSKAADLWRPGPSQSPCSSSSSNYPQSPLSYTPPSPDHNSLCQLLLNDEPSAQMEHELSDSDNEGEFFEPPPDGQPQVNHWIRNHQKDLESDGREVTLSDRVAQWQELIMPRLEANLEHGPYSHMKYAPILLELVNRDGWPSPYSHTAVVVDYKCLEDISDEEEFAFPLDWRKRKTPSELKKLPLSESHCVSFIPNDPDFGDPKDDDRWGGEKFYGFADCEQIKRRGFVLVPDFENSQLDNNGLFSIQNNDFKWGLSKEETEFLHRKKENEKWLSEKICWLQSKVKPGGSRRKNWEEWVEENDNVESSPLDVSSLHCGGKKLGQSQLVPFTTVVSGFRKEEVSRLLFTALHLASQGHMGISSSPGEINSMKLEITSSMDSR